VKSFERNILQLVGIKPVDHSLIGSVEGDPAAREKWLDTMLQLGMAAA
jgi:hypothetical protein